MLSLPPQLRIANAAAILEGPHGNVTRRLLAPLLAKAWGSASRRRPQ